MIAAACVVLGRVLLVAVLVLGALAYLAICLGRACEALDEESQSKRRVTGPYGGVAQAGDGDGSTTAWERA